MVNVIRWPERSPSRSVEEAPVSGVDLLGLRTISINAVAEYVRRFDDIALRYSALVHSFPVSKQRDDLLLDIGSARQIIRATLIKLCRTSALDEGTGVADLPSFGRRA